MARYFTQRELNGSIRYDNSDSGHRGTIWLDERVITVPGGTAAKIIDARFNSDGALVVKAEIIGSNNGYNQQTHFFVGPHEVFTEYNHSCNKPNGRLSDYNRAVQAARQEREGGSSSNSSSSGSSNGAGAFAAGAAIGTGLVQGLVNRREKKQLEKFQAEEERRQREEEMLQRQEEWEAEAAQREAELEEQKRIQKEQQEMKDQLALKQKEIEAYDRKVLLESMTPEERKAFLLHEKEEKRKEEERKQRAAEERERKAAERKKLEKEENEAKAKKNLRFNLIYYPVVVGLVIIFHLWFWMNDDFEWWQACLWGLLTLAVGGLAIFIAFFVREIMRNDSD